MYEQLISNLVSFRWTLAEWLISVKSRLAHGVDTDNKESALS